MGKFDCDLPMTRALLAGDKCEIRSIDSQLLRAQKSPDEWVVDRALFPGVAGCAVELPILSHLYRDDFLLSAARVGEAIWVSEPWFADAVHNDTKTHAIPEGEMVIYQVDGAVLPAQDGRSVRDAVRGLARSFLPRWASRMTLITSAVRMEQLQDITEEGALAEGVRRVTFGEVRTEIPHGQFEFECPDDKALFYMPGSKDCVIFQDTARAAFAKHWDNTHGTHKWANNPWVVVREVEVEHFNVSQFSDAA